MNVKLFDDLKLYSIVFYNSADARQKIPIRSQLINGLLLLANWPPMGLIVDSLKLKLTRVSSTYPQTAVIFFTNRIKALMTSLNVFNIKCCKLICLAELSTFDAPQFY